MTSRHDNTKRWRPRFSVRTLVVVVTLVYCYAACWGPTNRRGVADVTTAPFPLVSREAVATLIVAADIAEWADMESEGNE